MRKTQRRLLDTHHTWGLLQPAIWPRVVSNSRERIHMSADVKHEFPRWEALYREHEIESMHWFNPELDDDLKNALDELGWRDGIALDLGTGPGTQAMQLARRGFGVTAT